MLSFIPQKIIPFAVVGSERNVIIKGKTVRGRKNRWGIINVEDETHCEFVYLRDFLTRYFRPFFLRQSQRRVFFSELTSKT